jgi:hypothetical protein
MSLAHFEDPIDTTWRSTGKTDEPTAPSWLAPPLESQTFPVARTVTPSPPASTTAEPPSAEDALGAPDSAAAITPPEPREPAYPDLREENAVLRARLATQATVVAEIRRAMLVASEVDLVQLACVIAERIARRELTLDPTLAVEWARSAVEALVTDDPPCLLLAPDLAALVDEAALRGAIPDLATVRVDPSLPTMRCEVRTRSSRVDASLEARLGAIVDELGVQRP